MTLTYNPAARYPFKVSDVEFRRTPKRTLLARVYQPQGAGPFPALLDLHGGAWFDKDRLANAPMDEALAASGILVVAIDMTLSSEAPYPASVQDANYGIRWLKSKAPEWKGDPATLGALGSSSGGHVIELCAMRPRDPRYNAHPLPAAPDATLAYVATRSPIPDPYARFQQAEKMKRAEMVQKSRTYFNPWETIFEGNPQQILDRGVETHADLEGAASRPRPDLRRPGPSGSRVRLEHRIAGNSSRKRSSHPPLDSSRRRASEISSVRPAWSSLVVSTSCGELPEAWYRQAGRRANDPVPGAAGYRTRWRGRCPEGSSP